MSGLIQPKISLNTSHSTSSASMLSNAVSLFSPVTVTLVSQLPGDPANPHIQKFHIRLSGRSLPSVSLSNPIPAISIQLSQSLPLGTEVYLYPATFSASVLTPLTSSVTGRAIRKRKFDLYLHSFYDQYTDYILEFRLDQNTSGQGLIVIMNISGNFIEDETYAEKNFIPSSTAMWVQFVRTVRFAFRLIAKAAVILFRRLF